VASAAVTLLLALGLAACGGDGAAPDPATTAVTEAATDGTEEATDTEAADEVTEEATEEENEAAAPDVDPAEVGADELGLVPVLMYHQLREDGGSEYDLTPEEYTAELEWLFDNGFRPITTTQLVRGEIDVPAGTTPVVLTYDDSTVSQAQLTDDGELDPDTALGILVEVASRYDDVEPRGSVYSITSSLFGGTPAGEEVLAVLHELGMELGNHTHGHPSLASLDDDGARRRSPATSRRHRSRAGRRGGDPLAAARHLPGEPGARGQRVGAVRRLRERRRPAGRSEPGPSPFHGDFDPHAVPRIRSSPSWQDGDEPTTARGSGSALLERGETYRPYVSDGNPDTISFPATGRRSSIPRWRTARTRTDPPVRLGGVRRGWRVGDDGGTRSAPPRRASRLPRAAPRCWRWTGLERALSLAPDEVTTQVDAAGLRGRGGAGFPTARKWRGVQATAAEAGGVLTLVANAAEGEPGTYKDRTLLEQQPYAFLEGVCIALHATGAREAFAGSRRRRRARRERLVAALTEVVAAGWPGAERIRLVSGPDAYLFGEESAMLEVIEGKLPMPRIVKPFERGLHATTTIPNPTIVNNVETLSHVPRILAHGADWFRATGTHASPGSMVFTVVGDVASPGVFELPLGTPLRVLLEDIAGAEDVKAVYSGVSNAVITPPMLDTPLCFDAMQAAGTGLGSGGFIVYDASRSIVDVLAVLVHFLAIESCLIGPGRVGPRPGAGDRCDLGGLSQCRRQLVVGPRCVEPARVRWPC
jgi:NADH:ubiquinone oxidoreductase subunit F (NADH-binding)